MLAKSDALEFIFDFRGSVGISLSELFYSYGSLFCVLGATLEEETELSPSLSFSHLIMTCSLETRAPAFLLWRGDFASSDLVSFTLS